jgi:hypothetical protein
LKYPDGYAGDENRTISEFLVKIGGKSYNGYPNYRLVISEQVFERKGAAWHDWDDNIAVGERSEVVRKVVQVVETYTRGGQTFELVVPHSVMLPGNKPTRVVTEVRRVPKYSHLDLQGWILERWFPPSMFGSPESWYARKVSGSSVPMLGPYPSEGLYEMIAGVFPEVPSQSFLQEFIRFQRQRAQEAEERDARAVIAEKMARHEKAEANKAENLRMRIREMISPLVGTSLAAGRWRNTMAEKAGIRSHMGN